MKKLYFLLAFCLVSHADAILFQNDFSKPEDLRKNWRITDGVWRIDRPAGTLRQSIGAPHRLGRIFLNKTLPRNFEVSFDFTFLGGKSVKGCGGRVLLHYKENKSSYFQISIATHGQSGLRLCLVAPELKNNKIVNKYETLASVDSKTFRQNQKYHLKILSRDSVLTIWLDGEELMEYKDAAPGLSGGLFGLSTYGAAMDFDDLKLEEIAK